jgi:hypothetical protein
LQSSDIRRNTGSELRQLICFPPYLRDVDSVNREERAGLPTALAHRSNVGSVGKRLSGFTILRGAEQSKKADQDKGLYEFHSVDLPLPQTLLLPPSASSQR